MSAAGPSVSSRPAAPRGESDRAARPLWELPACLAVAVLAALVLWRALSDGATYDFGFAYNAGEVAWRTGHPESLPTFTGTPVLAALMALVSQTLSQPLGKVLITIASAAAAAGMAAGTWTALRPRLPRVWWWVTLTGAVLFAPVCESLWWGQFNIIVFALGALGFALAGGGRAHSAGAAIALSVAIKPLLVLLPLALLLRRGTRRAGLWSLAWGAGLLVASQTFLALRAHSLAALSPHPLYDSFSHKAAAVYGCSSPNFSPAALLCRLADPQHWQFERFAGVAVVALLALLARDVLRTRPATSWLTFAFVCLLSPMVSPIEWNHYALLMLPLLVLLTSEFVRHGASAGMWAALATAYVLASLEWLPYGTAPGALRELITGHPEDVPIVRAVSSVALFAQYLLCFTALVWWTGRDVPARRSAAQ